MNQAAGSFPAVGYNWTKRVINNEWNTANYD